MSVKVSSRVWEQSRQTEPSKKLLLLALADRADDDGVCWPSVNYLAERIHASERHTRRLLRDLEAAGELLTFEQRGRGHTPTYVVTVGLPASHIAQTLSRHERLRGATADPDALAEETARRQKPDIWAPENRTSGHQKTGHLGTQNRTSGAEKGTSSAHKTGHLGTQNRTSGHTKPDIAMSPDTSVDPSEETSTETSTSSSYLPPHTTSRLAQRQEQEQQEQEIPVAPPASQRRNGQHPKPHPSGRATGATPPGAAPPPPPGLSSLIAGLIARGVDAALADEIAANMAASGCAEQGLDYFQRWVELKAEGGAGVGAAIQQCRAVPFPVPPPKQSRASPTLRPANAWEPHEALAWDEEIGLDDILARSRAQPQPPEEPHEQDSRRPQPNRGEGPTGGSARPGASHAADVPDVPGRAVGLRPARPGPPLGAQAKRPVSDVWT
jgi:hypothetical protein